MTFGLSLPVHSGLLKRIDYPKRICLAHARFLNVFTALKGIHFYCLFVLQLMLSEKYFSCVFSIISVSIELIVFWKLYIVSISLLTVGIQESIYV